MAEGTAVAKVRTNQLTDAELERMQETSKIGNIDLSLVKFDRSYQRAPSKLLVDEIAQNWDIIASELILVSDRGDRDEKSGVEGGLFVINGQHRSIAARQLGLKKVPARIVALTMYDDPGRIEAALRLKTNVRLADNPYDRFKAQVRAGDEESIAIVKLLAEFDTEINSTPVPDTGINAVATVEQLYRFDEGTTLREAFRIIREAWGYVGGKNTGSNPLKAIAWFIQQHEDETDRDRFIQKVSENNAATLDRRARITQSSLAGALWMNYYRTLVEIYNERLTQGSRIMWRTRGSSQLSRTRSGDRSGKQSN